MPRMENKPALAVVFLLALPAFAAPPDWLQSASRERLPQYPDNPAAVMLRNEQVATVKSNGEVTTLYRRAYKILRPEGRRYGTVQIYFDSEARVESLQVEVPGAGWP